jgi:tRNA pseudouridine38-40 synthase
LPGAEQSAPGVDRNCNHPAIGSSEEGHYKKTSPLWQPRLTARCRSMSHLHDTVDGVYSSSMVTSEKGRRNVCLLLEYDGLPFYGWQVQPLSPTIQEVIQNALSTITGEEVNLKASGRTDSGVHALGQVANFHTFSTLDADIFRPALNSLLPPSISVLDAREVPADFDSQFSAIRKLYCYRILINKTRSALEPGRSWYFRHPLDVEKITIAGRALVGKHDFSAFRASGGSARTSVRTIGKLEISRSSGYIFLDIEANGFLRHMVRNIAGTLVDVGRGRFSPTDIPSILESKDRSRAGVTAPPHGLYLVSVTYPSGIVGWEHSSTFPLRGKAAPQVGS